MPIPVPRRALSDWDGHGKLKRNVPDLSQQRVHRLRDS